MSEVCYEDIPSNAVEKIKSLSTTDASFSTIAFAPNGGWVIISGDNGACLRGVPSSFMQAIKTINQQNSVIKTIALTPSGGWVIINDKNSVCCENIPQSLIDKIKTLRQQQSDINTIALAPNGGWVIIKDQNGAIWDNIPSSLVERIKTINQHSGSIINTVAFAPNGGWVIANRLATERGLPNVGNASDGTYRLLTSQASGYYTPCYILGDIKACYKINEIQNFARQLCASGNSEACAALEHINKMVTQGTYASLTLSISRPVY